MTDQGVLKVPQHHNIIVQSVCPSFLRRKRKAVDTPTHLLTKNDVHLLINFNLVNQLIKNRAGQGLTGQSEELEELLSKILKDELREGVVTKIHDDLVIGRDT